MSGQKNIATIIQTWVLLPMLILFASSAFAQQDPIYSQYMNNLLSVNPSYAGVGRTTNITALHRAQWINLDGSTQTSSLTFTLPLDSMHVGTGVDFIYDHTRPVTTSGFFVNYAYRINVTPNSELSLGLKAGFNFMQTRLTELDRYDEDDAYIIGYGDFDRFMPNFGVGLYYTTENFDFGFSIPRIIENRYNKNADEYNADSREERYYFINGTYRYPLSPKILLKPAVGILMTKGAPVTADLDLAIGALDRFWIGAMYRISDAVGGYVQVKFENVKFGFAYDYSHSRLRYHQNGTFEFMLQYEIRKREKSIDSE